ncbi:MAG: hypothetical protein A2V70_01535 [Planctomycetes bacterium RBG_13_63_9]|nr:MAG: hypothetical protein A2V70_01535 [Planctomycetes bacterium RBG_13_63_9]
MIEVKTAVANALEFLGQMYPEGQIMDPRLEEVELSGDFSAWCVTLSFMTRGEPRELAAVIRGGGARRLYKVITVEGETGKVQSMKMRQTV